VSLWSIHAALAAALLASGPRDYPSLHVALDTAMALLPAVLGWLLWDIGRRLDRRLPQYLAVPFALSALLNLVHMLVAVEWSGAYHFIAERAASLSPATWPPSTHLLPIGALAAISQAGKRRGRALSFTIALIVLAVVLVAAFQELPRYTAPTALRITRPFLVGAPLLWAVVAVVCLRRRGPDRLLQPIGLMALTLVAANVAMLYSSAPHDTAAMIAHLGRVCAYLLLLLTLMQMATRDMQVRLRTEASLERANIELEARVAERTADLARAIESTTESETRFRAFVSATTDVIYRMSPDWSEMRHLVGQAFIADTTAPDRNWLEKYIHPDDQERVLEAIGGAIRSKSCLQLEHRMRRVDGALAWTFSRAIPLLNEAGEIIEWFGAASDVTQRKQAEVKLQSQLSRLNLLDQITRAIGERQDAGSIYQVVLGNLEEQLPVDLACVYAYRASDRTLMVAAVGAKSARLGTISPDGSRVAVEENGLARCLTGALIYEPDGGQSASALARRLAQGGLRAWVACPLQVESSVFGMLIVARKASASFSSGDCEFLRQVSDHVALGAHQAGLYTSLQRAYDDLRKTQESVMQQERLRALGQMASGIAHDINNALSPAALYVQWLVEREGGLSAQAREHLVVIQRAIEDVGHTVARMRMFSRPRERELTLSLIDLNTLLHQVTDLTRARWSAMPQERGIVIELKSNLSADLPRITGAENEIRDAVTNLVLNAVDAMPEGGTLTLCSRAGVSRRAPTSVASVIVEVSDTGVGMSAEVRDRCLEPFFTTKGERGTGLGLAMVFGMVQRHSAEFDIDSTPGIGTTVRLTFDAAAPAQRGAEPRAPCAPRALQILLVDDDPLLLKSLRDVLESDGHRVTSADGGRRGIEQFLGAKQRDQSFEAVITDLGMPNIDGRAVAAAVKTASPSTPVILLTGWGQRIKGDSELPEHVDRVLSKPPHLSELRAALDEVQEHRAGQSPGEPS